MSRIGKKILTIPKGVEIKIDAGTIKVKGPKGSLEKKVPPFMNIEIGEGFAKVVPQKKEIDKKTNALWGLTRALINNMIIGTTQGYVKSLDLIGVGFRAKVEGAKLTLTIGLSHPVIFNLPKDVKAEIKDTKGQKENQVILYGIDKEVMGLLADKIKRVKPPEPYKGKGIRYSDEHIIQKAGKAAVKSGK